MASPLVIQLTPPGVAIGPSGGAAAILLAAASGNASASPPRVAATIQPVRDSVMGSEREVGKRMLERKRTAKNNPNAGASGGGADTEAGTANGGAPATAAAAAAAADAASGDVSFSARVYAGYESSSLSLFSSALLELAQSLSRLRPSAPIEKVARLVSLCPKLPAARAMAASWLAGFTHVDAALTDASADDAMFDGKPYESISFAPPPAAAAVAGSAAARHANAALTRGGTHAMDRRSEESVLAVGQFLVLSRGQYGESLIPKLLQYAIALPFFRWNQRDQPVESSQRFSQALVSLLVEIAVRLPACRVHVISTIVALIKLSARFYLAEHKRDRELHEKASAASARAVAAATSVVTAPSAAVLPAPTATAAPAVLAPPSALANGVLHPPAMGFPGLMAPANLLRTLPPLLAHPTPAATAAPAPHPVVAPPAPSPLQIAASQATAAANQSAAALAQSPIRSVLVGVLRAIAASGIPFDDATASDVMNTLQQLYAVPDSLPVTALVLGAITAVYSRHTSVFARNQLNGVWQSHYHDWVVRFPQVPPHAFAGASAAAGGSTPHAAAVSGGSSGRIGGGATFATSNAALAAARERKLASAPMTKTEQEQSTELLLHAIRIGVLCAVANSELRDKTISSLHDILSKVLDRNKDRAGVARAHAGCIELARSVMTGLTQICIHYPSVDGCMAGIIHYVRSILLTSRRLCRHPREKELRYIMIHGLSEIFKSELARITDLDVAPTSGSHAHSAGSTLQHSVSAASLASLSPSPAPLATLTHSQSSSTLTIANAAAASAAAASAAAAASSDGRSFTFSATETRKFIIGLLNGLWRTDSSAYSDIGSSAVQPRESIVSRDDIEHSTNSNPSSDPESVQQLQRVLITLLTITSHVNKPKVTALVLPTLLQRFSSSPRLLHVVISHLTDIAIQSTNRDDFDDIVSLFVSTYQRKPSAVDADLNKYNMIEIPTAFTNLTTRRDTREMRTLYLRRMLKLFNDLGLEINDQCARTSMKETARAGVCGFILPTLAALITSDDFTDAALTDPISAASAAYDQLTGKPVASTTLVVAGAGGEDTKTEESISNSDSAAVRAIPASALAVVPIGMQAFDTPETNVKWFRRLWFFLVSFQFVSDEVWRFFDWFSSVVRIASNTPVLIVKGKQKQKYLGDEIETDVKSMGTSESSLHAIRVRLQQKLPALQWDIGQHLSPQKSMYLLAVYYLETLRVQSGRANSYTAIFEYLNDDSMGGGEFGKYISAIADHVFVASIHAFDAQQHTAARHAELESRINFLLVKCTSRYEVVRNKAGEYLNRLTNRYPHVQWAKLCLSVLLDLLHVIESTLDTDSLIAGTPPPKPTLTFGSTELLNSLDLPESRALRMILLEKLSALAVSWLREARHAVAHESVLVVSEYVQAVQRRAAIHNASASSGAAHLGVSIALKHVAGTDRDTGTTFAGALSAAGAAAGTGYGAAQYGAAAGTGAAAGHAAGAATAHSVAASNGGSGLAMAGLGGDGLALSRSAALPGLISSLSVKERSWGEIAGMYDHFLRQSHSAQSQAFAQSQSSQPAVVTPLSSVSSSTRFFQSPITTTRPIAQPIAAPVSAVDPSLPFGKMMSQKLKRDAREIVMDYRSLQQQANDAGYAAAERRFNVRVETMMYHTAALLLWAIDHPSVEVDTHDLLHLTCKVPSQVFTPAAMTAAVFVWEWLLSVNRTNFEVPLFVEMKAAWASTVDRQLGLFARPQPQAQSQSQSAAVAPAATTAIVPPMTTAGPALSVISTPYPVPDVRRNARRHESVMPHVIWTRFLRDRFRASQSASRETVNVLSMMLHKAFARPELMTTEPHTFGARFRLLYLGLKLVQSDTSQELRDKELLRDRIYACALHWFYHKPAWYDPGSPALLREDTEIVIEFLKTLQFEDKYWAKSNAPLAAAMDGTDLKEMLAAAGSAAVTGTGAGGTPDTPISRSRGMTDQALVPPGATNGNGTTTGNGAGAATAAAAATPVSGKKSRNPLPLHTVPSLGNVRRASIAGPVPAAPAGPPPVVPPLLPSSSTSNLHLAPPVLNMAYMSGAGIGNGNGAAYIHAGSGNGDTRSVRSGRSEDSVSIIFNPASTSQFKKMTRLNNLRNLLLLLMSHELDRIVAWHNPRRIESGRFKDEHLFSSSQLIASLYPRDWKGYLDTAWFVDPRLAIRVADRFPMVTALKTELAELVKLYPQAVYHVPEAVMYLATDANVKSGAAELRHLMYWTPCTMPVALKLLAPPYSANRTVKEYAVHSLRSQPNDNILFYLPQIVQLLHHDTDSLVRAFLSSIARTSMILAHQLIWACQAELGQLAENKKESEEPYRVVIDALMNSIVANFTEADDKFHQAEFDFFNRITTISGLLKPLSKGMRKKRMKDELEKINVKTLIYLPTEPSLRVLRIIATSGRALKSAQRVPMMVSFRVKRMKSIAHESANLDWPETEESANAPAVVAPVAPATDSLPGGLRTTTPAVPAGGKPASTPMSPILKQLMAPPGVKDEKTPAPVSNAKSPSDNKDSIEAESEAAAKRVVRSTGKSDSSVFPATVIFKLADDCRQDALCITIIQSCKNVFASVGLELFLYPYRVLPLRISNDCGGIIECVPNSKTRDEIGKANPCSLKNYFILKFGREDGAAYQRAQRNFILSLASYAIVSYILQVKDRHNGNLMIDDQGHVIHIDFGFVFEISPARDMKFESAGFKLTLEMVEIMGGSPEAPLYQWFQSLVVRGFLAVREHVNDLISLVEPMLGSGLKCFKTGALDNFRNRFFPDTDEKGAADAVMRVIYDAHNKWTTNTYDYIQARQQDIFYYTAATQSEYDANVTNAAADDADDNDE